jgi:hypothetical protein
VGVAFRSWLLHLDVAALSDPSRQFGPCHFVEPLRMQTNVLTQLIRQNASTLGGSMSVALGGSGTRYRRWGLSDSVGGHFCCGRSRVGGHLCCGRSGGHFCCGRSCGHFCCGRSSVGGHLCCGRSMDGGTPLEQLPGWCQASLQPGCSAAGGTQYLFRYYNASGRALQRIAAGLGWPWWTLPYRLCNAGSSTAGSSGDCEVACRRYSTYFCSG